MDEHTNERIEGQPFRECDLCQQSHRMTRTLVLATGSTRALCAKCVTDIVDEAREVGARFHMLIVDVSGWAP